MAEVLTVAVIVFVLWVAYKLGRLALRVAGTVIAVVIGLVLLGVVIQLLR